MSAPAEITQCIESLLTAPLYGLDPEQRQRSLLAVLKKELAYACEQNARFRNYVEHWPVDFQTADKVADLPYLPAGTFKTNPALALVDAGEIRRTLTSSATTGQAPSRVVLDGETSKRMTKGVTKIIRDFIGPARRPYLVIAYVTNTGAMCDFCGAIESPSVSVIDTTTYTVVATIPVGQYPAGVAITPNGALAYVANFNSNSVSVIDTATNTVTASVAVGTNPLSVAITPNGAFAYVTNYTSQDVSVINTTTNAVVATVATGSPAWSVAITPNGSFAYLTNPRSNNVSVINTATNAVVATVAVGCGPTPVAITPNGAFAYVGNSCDSTVSVIDTATNTVVANVAVGGEPQNMAITPDGSFAYTSNVLTNNLSVISTATNTVVDTVQGAGTQPEGIAIKLRSGAVTTKCR